MIYTTIYYSNSRGKSGRGFNVKKRGAERFKVANQRLGKFLFRLFSH